MRPAHAAACAAASLLLQQQPTVRVQLTAIPSALEARTPCLLTVRPDSCCGSGAEGRAVIDDLARMAIDREDWMELFWFLPTHGDSR